MFSFFRIILILFFLIINIFAKDEFYTVSICSNLTYKDAIFCKDNILKENKYGVAITREKGTQYYRTNYGIFESKEEAKKLRDNLTTSLYKFKPFVLKIDRKNLNFDVFEIFQKDLKDDINKEEKTKIEIRQDTNKEKIALLTFDDGPLISTKNILEVISEEDIPVSMFFIGHQIENFKSIYEETLSFQNITIGNHTYSHASNKYIKFYSNPVLVVEDVKKTNVLLSINRKSKTSSAFLPVRLAGRNVFRLPTITKNDNMIEEKQREIELIGYDDIYKEGFYVYGWDLEWSYEKNGKPIQTPNEIYELMEKVYTRNHETTNKVVLLMHDFMFTNNFNGKENLKTLIGLLKNNGWSFQNIDSY